MTEIITEEIAFSENMPFPPFMSRERMDSYKVNLKRFKGEYNEDNYIKIKNIKGKYDRFNLITENYYKLITLKLQGLLLNEKPIIGFMNNEDQSNQINTLINNSGFWTAFQQAFRNYSSLGTGALYLSFSEGQPRVNAVNPSYLYKIVDKNNVDNVRCFVLAQPIFTVDYKTAQYTKIEYMKLLFHYKGYYIERIFKYNENGHLQDLQSERTVETGLTDFAVFTFENCPAADEIYGNSDYECIKDIVLTYETILTTLNAVNIKNINPIVKVPTGVLIENEQTGEVEAPDGGSWIEADGDITYITYPNQIVDNCNFLGLLFNDICIQSEMSRTFLTGEFTSNLSGEAIKSLMKAPLDKIGRSIDQLDEVIKRLFIQMLYLVGIQATPSDITIRWRDGINQTEDDNLTPVDIMQAMNGVSQLVDGGLENAEQKGVEVVE